MRETLEVIFPGHGIDADAVVGELPAAQRQMVEIARAFSTADKPARLVILDEPTASLGATRGRAVAALHAQCDAARRVLRIDFAPAEGSAGQRRPGGGHA